MGETLANHVHHDYIVCCDEEVCEYYTHLSVPFCVVYFVSAVDVYPGHCDDTAVIGQWHCAVC